MQAQNFGKYEIRELIGQGAMGAVHRAWDTSLNRLVAVKTMTPSLTADPELKVRFYREAQATAQLQHPNITTIFDYGEAGGTVFIAMELVDGLSLRDILARQKVPLERKIDWMIQICRALGFAHKHGIVHRDVKPGNVLINGDGAVKILDFGIAHLESSDLTQTGACLGTPEYMSPELVRGQRVDGRSDVFSCGVVFYEMATGKKPFGGGAITKLMNEILTADPPPPTTLLPSLPAALDTLIAKMLQKDPAARCQDLDDAANDLKELQSELILIRAEKVRQLKKAQQELHAALASAASDPFAAAVVNRRFAAPLAHRKTALRNLTDLSNSSVGIEDADEELAQSHALLDAIHRFLKKELPSCIRLRDQICTKLEAAIGSGNTAEGRRLLTELAEIGADDGLLKQWRSRFPNLPGARALEKPSPANGPRDPTPEPSRPVIASVPIPSPTTARAPLESPAPVAVSRLAVDSSPAVVTASEGAGSPRRSRIGWIIAGICLILLLLAGVLFLR